MWREDICGKNLLAGSSKPFSVPKEPVVTALEEMGIAHDNKPGEASKWAPADVTYGRERR